MQTPDSQGIAMEAATITLEVDADAAQAFASASPEERCRLQLLLRLRLRELVARPTRPLREVMDQVGEQAEARGLTPGILESLLRDE